MSARPVSVLIVDDEVQIRRFLKAGLGAQGYATTEAGTGAEALAAFARDKPDLVILDLGLPDRDGASIVSAIREKSQVPIIILSVRDDETVKVEALDLGADDYVTKPFGMSELVARIRAALRHRLQETGSLPVFEIGGLKIDLLRRLVSRDGQRLELTPKEYEVLSLLVRHPGKVLTHGHILREVWGVAHVEDVQYLRGYVRQLRNKLEPDPARPAYLLTEPGVGYRFSLPE